MTRTPRKDQDLKCFVEYTLADLAHCYAHQKPGADDVAYLTEIVGPVLQLDDPEIEQVGEILLLYVSDSDRAKGVDYVSRSPYGPIIVATAFCVRAGAAYQERKMDLAWSYMADARYWVGVSLASRGLDIERNRTITTTRAEALVEAIRQKAKSGADGREKKYEQIREHAYQLVRDRKPESGYKSRSHAVRTIQKQVHEYSTNAENNVPALSEESLSRTVDSWLSKMPDGSKFFGSKKADA